MKIPTGAKVLKIYIGEDDKWRSGLLYPAIVERLKEIGIAGVTVMHGTQVYGAPTLGRASKLGQVFLGRPVVIEAVDVSGRIDLALTALDEMVAEGLVTVYDVSAIRYTPDPKA
jgi:PII-like signaling protein